LGVYLPIITVLIVYIYGSFLALKGYFPFSEMGRISNRPEGDVPDVSLLTLLTIREYTWMVENIRHLDYVCNVFEENLESDDLPDYAEVVKWLYHYSSGRTYTDWTDE